MNSSNQPVPRVPIRPAPPPPTSNKQDTSASSRRSGLSITKLLPNIMRKPSTAPSQNSTATAKKAPPPRPPPPKFPPKKQVIDLLSGSPPSSPSPTLRSQESGFEEDPELWRGWSDSSRSTPLMDWPSEPSTTLIEWPSEPMATSAAAAASTPHWKSEPATPMCSAPTPVQQTAGLCRPQTMPTIIRPGPSKRNPRQQQDEENYSPPMPSFPPPAPPPDLLDDTLPGVAAPNDCKITEVANWRVVAVYDYAASHPDDLTLKVGDEIDVLSTVDDNWLLGKVGDRIGHFPACFVRTQE